MNIHQRNLIRDAVVSALKNGNTLAGQRVFGNRAEPIKNSELPAILVYTKSEQAEISADAPREYKRTLNLDIEIAAASDSKGSVDDVLDQLAKEVESVMFIDETFGGLVTDTILGETIVDLLDDGEVPIGGLRITFLMPYFDQLPAGPAEELDAFKRSTTVIDVSQTEETQKPEDDITLAQN